MQRRSLNPLRELALFHSIRQIYARERPDLAHHFTLKCVVYGGLAARLTGVAARIHAVTRTRFEPPRRYAPPLLIQGGDWNH